VLPSGAPSECRYTIKRLGTIFSLCALYHQHSFHNLDGLAGGEDAALKRLDALMRLPLTFKQGDAFLTPARLTSPSEDASLTQVFSDRKAELGKYFEQLYELWSEKRLVRQVILSLFFSFRSSSSALFLIEKKIMFADSQISMSLLHGSPGMGNSAFMDVLANMSSSQVRATSPSAAPDEFCRWFAESIHVSIDLTVCQPITDIKLDNIERILAVLTLHKYNIHTF
jgi:hypothetical protein